MKKRARKYVFFDIHTGQIVFEWGGLRDQLMFRNSQQKQVKIYELGLLIREDSIQFRKGRIHLFYAGDIMDKKIKEKQIIMDWGIFFIEMNISSLRKVPLRQQ